MYYFHKKLTARRGFTLVEILVVVAIIGILSSVALGALGDARAAARDGKRQIELKNLSLAIILYKEANDRYPKAGCGADASADEWSGVSRSTESGFAVKACDEWIDVLATSTTYISKLPKDPRFEGEDNKGYYYRTNADGTEYKIIIKDAIEKNTISAATDDFARYDGSCTSATLRPNDYAVYDDNNPNKGNGSECW